DHRNMQRKITFSVNEYYHLYNRGVEKRNIFIDKNDWARFHRLLYLANGTNPIRFHETDNLIFSSIDRGDPLVAVGAYVLMPNHFHILVKEITEKGLSKFMEKLNTGYSMYFNKKYERVGPLFQGRFKGEHVDTDEYLKYLYAYIHLNPIKLIEPNWKEIGIKDEKRALKYVSQYHYSSYEDYCGIKREEGAILSKDEFPLYFSKDHDFKLYINDWLTLKD
ncbi:MAG: transposase, partial [Candidatus Wildermuthbacteria bacterium]|nr:transposase [Candidatus Wildermuthbacteria bacterium]